MPGFTIDLTEVTAILVGGALLMVPVLGLTLRLVVPPIVEAVARSRTLRPAGGRSPIVSSRAGERARYVTAGADAGEEGARERVALPH